MAACWSDQARVFLDTPTDGAGDALTDSAHGRSLSHRALRDAAASAAERLAGERSLVFLFCRNDAPTVITYLACAQAGHAVALLDSAMSPEQRRALLALYRPEWLVGADPIGDEAWREAGAGLTHMWRRSSGHGGELHPDLFLLLSTSGSTGSPKLVRLTQGAVEANARSIREALRIDGGERAVASLPLHYSYGLSVLNSHLCAGGSVVLTDESVLSPTFWDLVRRHQCTSMAGVPYSYQMLDRIGFERMDLPSLRTLTQAGGRLAVPLIERFHGAMAKRGGRLFVMYGQTEATARIAYLPPERLPEKIGSVGVAIPGGSLEVVEGGEVVYRGPNVMMGYASSRADLARGDELGGVLHTGDLGRLDAEGYLFVTGRTKRIAKVFGNRVNLDEVETLLKAHGPTAAVSGEDQIRLYCEYGDGELYRRLALELAGALRLHHRAFQFRRIAAMPLMSNGKVDYSQLQRDG